MQLVLQAKFFVNVSKQAQVVQVSEREVARVGYQVVLCAEFFCGVKQGNQFACGEAEDSGTFWGSLCRPVFRACQAFFYRGVAYVIAQLALAQFVEITADASCAVFQICGC